MRKGGGQEIYKQAGLKLEDIVKVDGFAGCLEGSGVRNKGDNACLARVRRTKDSCESSIHRVDNEPK